MTAQISSFCYYFCTADDHIVYPYLCIRSLEWLELESADNPMVSHWLACNHISDCHLTHSSGSSWKCPGRMGSICHSNYSSFVSKKWKRWAKPWFMVVIMCPPQTRRHQQPFEETNSIPLQDMASFIFLRWLLFLWFGNTSKLLALPWPLGSSDRIYWDF